MPDPRIGDIGFVASHGFVGWAIRTVTRSPANHVVVYVGDHQIVEGDPHGALLSPLHRHHYLAWSDFPLTVPQRDSVAAWSRAHVGTPYSWVDDCWIGVAKLLHRAPGYVRPPKFMRARLASTATLQCAQLADAAYEQAGYHLFDDHRENGAVSPGDILELVGVVK